MLYIYVLYFSFRNISSKTTVLLENPIGEPTLDDSLVALGNAELGNYIKSVYNVTEI